MFNQNGTSQFLTQKNLNSQNRFIDRVIVIVSKLLDMCTLLLIVLIYKAI